MKLKNPSNGAGTHEFSRNPEATPKNSIRRCIKLKCAPLLHYVCDTACEQTEVQNTMPPHSVYFERMKTNRKREI